MVSAAVPWTGIRRWLVPGPVIVLLLLSIGAILLFPGSRETVGFLGLVGGMAVAGVMYFRRSRKLEKRERLAWRMFGTANLLAAIGVAIIGVLTESGVDLPAFGALDAFFLGGYVCLIVALVRMTRLEGGGREWIPTILDALVGGISLSVLVWTTLFQDLLTSLSGARWWETVIAATYPVFDVAVIVGLIILVIRRSHFHLDLRVMFVALALSSQVVSDMIYFNQGVGRTFAEAEPSWLTLLIMALMFVAGSAIVDVPPKKREFPETDVPLWAIAWPYLLASSLLAVLVSTYRELNPSSDAVLLLDAVIAVGVLVFFRQLLAIRRNQVRVERQRSDLVASVSHELRTPLTAIVGYLKLLDGEGDSFPEDARREMVGEASAQAQHMARLVSDLVMLARGVHRDLPLEISEVSLSGIVNTALRNTDSEDTRIEVDLNAETMVRIDPVRIQQALTNLLTNAVRYGGDRALLVARAVRSDLILEMHDDGVGVPTRYEAMIWQRFERGANRFNAGSPGLGIGLAIVEAIATSHGGAASYRRSEELGGACFAIVLPGCVVQDNPIKVDAYI